MNMPTLGGAVTSGVPRSASSLPPSCSRAALASLLFSAALLVAVAFQRDLRPHVTSTAPTCGNEPDGLASTSRLRQPADDSLTALSPGDALARRGAAPTMTPAAFRSPLRTDRAPPSSDPYVPDSVIPEYQLLMSSSASGCMALAMPLGHAVNRAYAAAHGYGFIASARVREEGRRRHAVWGKINALQHFAQDAQWTLFLDLDAVVTNPAIPLSHFTEAHPGAELLVVQPLGPPGGGGDPMLNAGVILVKNTAWSAAFWAAVQALSPICASFPHEQGAMWMVITRLAAIDAERRGADAPEVYTCRHRGPLRVQLPRLLLDNPDRVVVIRHQHSINTLRGCTGPPPDAVEAAGPAAATAPAAQPRKFGWITLLPPDCMWQPGDFVAHYAPAMCPGPAVVATSYAALAALPAPHTPVIVTAVDEASAGTLLRGLLDSLSRSGERARVVVYDVGLSRASAAALARHPAVAALQVVDLEGQPAHLVTIAAAGGGLGAWAPVVLADALVDFDAVLWVHPALALPRANSSEVGNLPSVFGRMYADGMVAAASLPAPVAAAHTAPIGAADPATMSWLAKAAGRSSNAAGADGWDAQVNCSDVVVGFVRQHDAYNSVLRPWLNCALDEACITPSGAGAAAAAAAVHWQRPGAKQPVLSALVALARPRVRNACADSIDEGALSRWRPAL
jgi:hypothetical protein